MCIRDRPIRAATKVDSFIGVIPIFQSTLPIRAATQIYFCALDCSFSFQSTLPIRAATWKRLGTNLWYVISIHAAHAGSDLALLFLLRLTQISIHAAHTGSDIDRNTFKLCDSHFNPRCPYGQRQQKRSKIRSNLFCNYYFITTNSLNPVVLFFSCAQMYLEFGFKLVRSFQQFYVHL